MGQNEHLCRGSNFPKGIPLGKILTQRDPLGEDRGPLGKTLMHSVSPWLVTIVKRTNNCFDRVEEHLGATTHSNRDKKVPTFSECLSATGAKHLVDFMRHGIRRGKFLGRTPLPSIISPWFLCQCKPLATVKLMALWSAFALLFFSYVAT